MNNSWTNECVWNNIYATKLLKKKRVTTLQLISKGAMNPITEFLDTEKVFLVKPFVKKMNALRTIKEPFFPNVANLNENFYIKVFFYASFQSFEAKVKVNFIYRPS